MVTQQIHDAMPAVLKMDRTHPLPARRISKKAAACTKGTDVCKLWQVEFQIAMVTQDVKGGDPVLEYGEVPCALKVLDHGIGEMLRSVLLDNYRHVPFLDDLFAVFDTSTHAVVGDKDAANHKANRGQCDDRGEEHLKYGLLHWDDDIHGLNAAVWNAIGVLESDVSGIISLCLQLRQQGAVERFQEFLVRGDQRAFGSFPTSFAAGHC